MRVRRYLSDLSNRVVGLRPCRTAPLQGQTCCRGRHAAGADMTRRPGLAQMLRSILCCGAKKENMRDAAKKARTLHDT